MLIPFTSSNIGLSSLSTLTPVSECPVRRAYSEHGGNDGGRPKDERHIEPQRRGRVRLRKRGSGTYNRERNYRTAKSPALARPELLVQAPRPRSRSQGRRLHQLGLGVSVTWLSAAIALRAQLGCIGGAGSSAARLRLSALVATTAKAARVRISVPSSSKNSPGPASSESKADLD